MTRTNSPPSIARNAETAETASDEDSKITLLNLQENPALWYKVGNVLFLFFESQVLFQFI